MVRSNIYTKINRFHGDEHEHITYATTEEINICLNCPLPECKRQKCTRFDEEVKKVSTRRRRRA